MDNPAKPLDDWYKQINRMYLDRNYYRHPESIFSHLVEIVGGLSLLASDKTKTGVEPQAYIAKALAWWFSLCGKMRIRSVEDMLWSKYPYICPYCREGRHKNSECRKIKLRDKNPDWIKVHEIGEKNINKKPKTLGDWFKMFTSIYEAEQSENYSTTFARFTEELGELAEATRLFQLAPGYFFSEASDFFAWLMHLQALLFAKNNFLGDEGEELEKLMKNEYPGICPDCKNELCTCPPILKRTFGRIAHDMPINVDGEKGKALLDLNEAYELFQLSNKRIIIGQKEFEVTIDSITDMKNMISSLRVELFNLQGFTDKQTINFIDVIQKLNTLIDSERITQESINSLIDSISSLPTERRSTVINWLSGLSSSIWATAIIEGVRLIA